MLEKTTKGKLIALEGTDGAGKTVQLNLLKKRLKSLEIRFEELDLPRYGEPSSYFVKEYLNGRYGSLDQVDPRAASLFFALDRFDVSSHLHSRLLSGVNIISNRYIGSNMAHQGSRFESPEDREAFLRWLEEIEYNLLSVPRPDLNVVLHMPAEVALGLAEGKDESRRVYAEGKKRDIHEEDVDYLRKTESAYMELVEMRPKEFVVVRCFEEGKVLSPEEIHERVWLAVEPVLFRPK